MTQRYSLLIAGEFRDTRQTQELINPATGEAIAEAGVASAADLESALSSSRRAADSGIWSGLSLKERRDFLLKISRGILDKAGELARLETLNTGKPIKETTFMDIPSAAKTFEHFANNLEQYLKEEIRDIGEEAAATLRAEPWGVAVLIVPWNYPLLIASWKLAQALAAGNCAVLKPSSLTPLSVLELAKIIHAAGLPEGAVNIINASGETAGRLLCSDKRADMISFTGSNAVGRQIIGYCAEGVKKIILELGGKSAAVVLKDADLEAAVTGSLCSIFLNQGQMCTAMSRIFIEDAVYDKFVEDFTAKAKRIRLGNGLDYQTQMGPLISGPQRKKVIELVEKAERQGAKLISGGRIPDDPQLKDGFFFAPAIFTGVSPEMTLFKEEVFGPVVCLSRFSRPEEAVNLANRSDFALACSIWTKDARLAQQLSRRINAGIIWLNTYGMFYNEVPYGGFKQSGFGKELGREGLLEYTRLKNILQEKRQDAKPLVSCWYGF